MAASSGNSEKSGGKRTSKTASLTPDMALQILQESAARCREAGLKVERANLYHAGNAAVLIITGAEWDDAGNLIVASSGKEPE